MSITNANEDRETKSSTPATSVVDAVFDTALAWIDAGLGHVCTSLARGGRALIRTARTVDVVRERLRA